MKKYKVNVNGTVYEITLEVMEGAAELQVPLIADVSYGPTWAEAH